jgi:O-acetyl-ADP-ribose deacetylase (regulator of RNase III)
VIQPTATINETAMIRFTKGDILTAPAEALVNAVNCVGIMGRGIALQYKKAYPKNFELYEAACSRGELQPGRMFVTETGKFLPKYIINFPTKRHWRGKSGIEDIESGLEALVIEIRERKIKSIAVPALGSGLGGLDWLEVRPKIESALSGIPEADVLVFEPNDPPDNLAVASRTYQT